MHLFVFQLCGVYYIGEASAEIKTEADDDGTECSRDDKPSTGMFAVSDDIFSAVSCLYGELASEGQREACQPSAKVTSSL